MLQCVAAWCSVLQRVAMCCSLTATHYSTLQQCYAWSQVSCSVLKSSCNKATKNAFTTHLRVQRTKTNTRLQCTATHCNTLQRTATHCNALQRTATHCNALQHTATQQYGMHMGLTYMCDMACSHEPCHIEHAMSHRTHHVT